jgi:NADPH2:quinone reductase
MAETLPQTMKVAHFDAPGEPEVLQLMELPLPQLQAGDVLIKVAFAGVNRPDVIQRRGFYPAPPGASPVPGLEVSGEIVALGEGTDPALLGQLVCALTPGGGYAEYCRVPAGHCLPVPAGLPLDQAAALPETLFTVWHNVFERGYARRARRSSFMAGPAGSVRWRSCWARPLG